MNVVEVTEKNLREAIELYKRSKAEFFSAIDTPMKDDEALGEELMGYETGALSYVLADKGKAYALFTSDKDAAELSNLCIDYNAVDEAARERFLEFAIKQFSSITFVFTWADSLDDKLVDVLEGYGFEYTGEQYYLDKNKSVLRYHYVYRRKK